MYKNHEGMKDFCNSKIVNLRQNVNNIQEIRNSWANAHNAEYGSGKLTDEEALKNCYFISTLDNALSHLRHAIEQLTLAKEIHYEIFMGIPKPIQTPWEEKE